MFCYFFISFEVLFRNKTSITPLTGRFERGFWKKASRKNRQAIQSGCTRPLREDQTGKKLETKTHISHFRCTFGQRQRNISFRGERSRVTKQKKTQNVKKNASEKKLDKEHLMKHRNLWLTPAVSFLIFIVCRWLIRTTLDPEKMVEKIAKRRRGVFADEMFRNYKLHCRLDNHRTLSVLPFVRCDRRATIITF